MRLLRWLGRGLAALACLAAMSQVSAQGRNVRVVTLPGATDVSLFGINNAGLMVGGATIGGVSQTLLLNGGSVTTLSGPAGALGSYGFDASDSGVVVGSYYTTTTTDTDTGEVFQGPSRAFWYSGGSYTTYSVPGAINTYARGISPDGRFITGFYDGETSLGAFVLDTTGAQELQLFGGPRVTIAQGINSSYQVAGSDRLATAGFPKVGFVYNALTGERQNHSFADYSATNFRDINDAGQIGGWLTRPAGPDGEYRGIVGFYGTPGSFEVITVAGAQETWVEGINNAGWVVGNYANADGSMGAFYASPVPEPSAWMLASLGLLVLVVQRRRKRRT